MTRKLLGALIIVAGLASPALAQKITIDYAHEFDFDTIKTFQYHETAESDSKDSLMDGRIEKALMDALIGGGLQQVDSDPDLMITYHMTTKDNTVFNTSSYGYGGGYWGGWGGYGGMGGMGGMGGSTTTATTYTEGTLIVDGFDPIEKKMIWRGTGTVTIKAKPEKQVQQIDNILSKMGKKWEQILAKEGK